MLFIEWSGLSFTAAVVLGSLAPLTLLHMGVTLADGWSFWRRMGHAVTCLMFAAFAALL